VLSSAIERRYKGLQSCDQRCCAWCSDTYALPFIS